MGRGQRERQRETSSSRASKNPRSGKPPARETRGCRARGGHSRQDVVAETDPRPDEARRTIPRRSGHGGKRETSAATGATSGPRRTDVSSSLRPCEGRSLAVRKRTSCENDAELDGRREHDDVGIDNRARNSRKQRKGEEEHRGADDDGEGSSAPSSTIRLATTSSMSSSSSSSSRSSSSSAASPMSSLPPYSPCPGSPLSSSSLASHSQQRPPPPPTLSSTSIRYETSEATPLIQDAPANRERVNEVRGKVDDAGDKSELEGDNQPGESDDGDHITGENSSMTAGNDSSTTSTVAEPAGSTLSDTITVELSQRPRGVRNNSRIIAQARSTLESLREGLRALGNYDRSRIYLAHVSFLDWRDLPGRPRTEAGGRERERVWVVGAADHEGHHRTRLLVAGRHWRPRCLKRVNMLSQPVVYAGGGRGSLTADLFLWWFHREFAVTAMAMHPDGAVLVAETADYLPPATDCVTADGLVRLFVVPKDCLETRIVLRELRVKLATGVLTRAIRYGFHASPTTISSFPEKPADYLDTCLRRFTLKEAFAEFHRAWLSVRSETFARIWIVPRNAVASEINSVPRITIADQEEDRILLDELRTVARDAGLKVTEDELIRWIDDNRSETPTCVKKNEQDDVDCKVKIENGGGNEYGGRENDGAVDSNAEEFEEETEEDEDEPTAEETVRLLSRVLTWMEREPLDPGLLLAVRSMRDIAALMASKMGLTGTHPSGLPFFCPNGDHLTQPPPAHMGIPPYGALDAGKAAAAAGEYWQSADYTHRQPPSTHSPHLDRLLAAAASSGLTRAPMYPFSTGQYPYPMLSPEMTQVAASWHTPSMYPISPAGAGFRSPYPTSLPITSSSLPSDLYRFSPTGLMPPHPGLSPHAHALASHALVSAAPKADHSSLDHNHRSTIEQKNSTSLPTDNSKSQDTGQQNNQDKKKPHIKKPLNAFMLYMKEMRAKVVAECTLKESAAINQILGRRWHALGREEQAKYYELARRERQLHMQLYPDWSSRANTNRTKKRKRKQDTNSDPGGNNMKKCRARYGLDQQSQWCKPCRRKKKCIRYMGEGGDGDGEADGEGEDDHSEDNLGSVGEAGTPEDDESLSSPGGLSALSSLASPSLVLPSPSSLASPCPCPLTPPVVPSLPSNSSNQQQSQQQSQQQTQQQQQQSSQQQQQQQQQQGAAAPHRNPVGTNPHDINNPLSVNQLTGQCIKSDVGPAPSGPSNSAISVT